MGNEGRGSMGKKEIKVGEVGEVVKIIGWEVGQVRVNIGRTSGGGEVVK